MANDLTDNRLMPTFIMETSWEVCNKVGGIYTVLSTRAAEMIDRHGKENVLFIGPLLDRPQHDFIPSNRGGDLQLAESVSQTSGLKVVAGNWAVAGSPRVLLVDYQPLLSSKDQLYYELWQDYGIRGEIGYGDYDESLLFSIAVAKVMAAGQQCIKSERPLSIFNEWTTGAGLLYLKSHNPEMPTLFITHATSVGRSIAANGKPLYGQFENYDGDQMADELGVMCKHQVEKAAAHRADIFATVSELTAREAGQLLGRYPDAVLYNGFEPKFVPSNSKYKSLRAEGRKVIKHLAETLYGVLLQDDWLLIGTSGRSEYRNKGLDVFIDALRRIPLQEGTRPVVALIMVPSWTKAPRPELSAALMSGDDLTMPMQMPYITHELYDGLDNRISAHLHSLREVWGKRVYPIFIPAYLDGSDGVVNIPYYDLLPALDLTAFASYYEPWGYTPLESIAFGVPTLTTDKAGFGIWAMTHNDKNCLRFGAKALQREDDNFEELAETLATKINRFSSFDQETVDSIRERAKALSTQAEWRFFYNNYLDAYHRALGGGVI